MSPVLQRVEVHPGRAFLELRWDDGTEAEFASVWLRDNLPEHRDGFSGQRLIDILDLPPDPRIRSATVSGDELQIAWADDAPPGRLPGRWLYRYAAGRAPQVAPVPRLWLHGSQLHARDDFAWQSCAALRSDADARRSWLRRLIEDGIAFLRDVPCEEGGILAAMEPIGRIAETNYGLVFDVRAVPQPENLAYSDRGLGLHTDNPYREPVPGFQALHTLLAAPDGGDSLFADGFAVAEQLRRERPGAFALLTRVPVPFHYRSASADLAAERPLIALDCTGAVSAVHYNSRSMAPLTLPATDTVPFYDAYRQFAGLLRESRYQLRTRLEAGELALFDNQRVLHGRTAFASTRYARHLRGCYLTRDSVLCTHALLQHPPAARSRA